MKNILYITYNWPPRNTAGIYRILNTCNFLSKNGFSVTVLTANNYYDDFLDFDLLKQIDNNIKVIKIDNKKNCYKYIPPKNLLLKLLYILLYNFETKFIFPDEIYDWRNKAINEGKKFIMNNKVDIVYTSAPYFSCSYVGLELKKYFKDKIKLITEFRDLPSATVRKGYYKFNKKYFKFEENLIKYSDVIITDNPNKINYLTKIHNYPKSEKFHYFYSGYPDYMFTMPKSNSDRNYKVIRYVGGLRGLSLIPGFDKILIKAAKMFKNIVFEFVGYVNNDFKNSILKNNLKNIVFRNSVSLLESHKLIKDADGLLLLMNNVPYVDVMTSIKVFPYIASGNFIFAIIPKETNAAKLIIDTNTGIIIDPSCNNWKNLFYQNLLLFSKNKLFNNKMNFKSNNNILSLSTKSQLKKLLNII